MLETAFDPEQGTTMGCFCREAVRALREDNEEQLDDTAPVVEPDDMLSSISTWLAARWLPSPEWEPEEEWLEEEPPESPMPPEALAVITQLVQAYQDCGEIGVDLTDPVQKTRLARIVGTLNRRTEALQWVEQDTRPWDLVATLNDQADTVRTAVEQRILLPPDPPEPEPPLGPWRPFIAKMKAIAPLISIGQITQTDLSQPEAPAQLAKLVRTLRQVELPPLDNPVLVMRVIARSAAIQRLAQSLGADPQRVPFERVLAAVQRKVDAVKQTLPEELHLVDGRIQGLPPTQPNPSQLVNEHTVAAARKITPEVLDALQWDPPPFESFPLLTSGVPAMKLGRLMARSTPVVRTTPCGAGCDAGEVMRALDPTTTPGSGTGAGPAA